MGIQGSENADELAKSAAKTICLNPKFNPLLFQEFCHKFYMEGSHKQMAKKIRSSGRSSRY